MKRRDLVVALPIVGFGWCLPTRAAAPRPRLAIVMPGFSTENIGVLRSFSSELRRHGYIEGQTLAVDRYSAKGRLYQLAEISEQVVRSNPDCIFAVGLRAAKALKMATSVIPIVTYTVDPLMGGLVQSLAQPGGNVTGFSADPGPEFVDKIIEVLLQAAPHVKRVAHLLPRSAWGLPRSHWVSNRIPPPNSVVFLGPAEGDLAEEADYRRFFAVMTDRAAEAIVVGDLQENLERSELVISLVRQVKLPAIYADSEFVKRGGLISYGPDGAVVASGLVSYIVQVLKGKAPGELPFQEAWKFEMAINLTSARELGITFPRTIFARADIVVE
jgi:putative ABC transport system substrate-binding protein